MQVAKWGNSLAVRLPKALVEELGLKEGDTIELRRARDGALEVEMRREIQDAFEKIRSLRGTLPADHKFARGSLYPKRRGGTGRDE